MSAPARQRLHLRIVGGAGSGRRHRPPRPPGRPSRRCPAAGRRRARRTRPAARRPWTPSAAGTPTPPRTGGRTPCARYELSRVDGRGRARRADHRPGRGPGPRRARPDRPRRRRRGAARLGPPRPRSARPAGWPRPCCARAGRGRGPCTAPIRRPLLARLVGLEPLVRSDPAAHARLLAATAVGSCYDPDSSVPDSLSARALQIAERTRRPGRPRRRAAGPLPDVLGHRRPGRGVARPARAPGRAAPPARARRRGHRPRARGHRARDRRRGRGGGRARPARRRRQRPAAPARQPGAAALGRRAPWRSGTASSRAPATLYDHAFQIHAQTELYAGATYDVAMLALGREQGRLAEMPECQAVDPVYVPVGAGRARLPPGTIHAAGALITAELERPEPLMWTTLGRWTWLAHAAVEARLVSAVPALRERLEPYSRYVATIGQVGVVGPVALALGRLCALVGDLDAARRRTTPPRPRSAERAGGAGRPRALPLAGRAAGPAARRTARPRAETRRDRSPKPQRRGMTRDRGHGRGAARRHAPARSLAQLVSWPRGSAQRGGRSSTMRRILPIERSTESGVEDVDARCSPRSCS